MLQVHEVVLIVFFFLTGQLIIQAATSPVGYLRAVGKPETQREDGAIRQEGRHEMPKQKESSNLSFQTTKKCRLMDCPVGYYYLCIPLKNDEKTFRERCDFGVCERFEEGRRLVDDNGNIDSVHCQNNTYRNSPFTICEFDKTYCVEKHVFTGKGEYTIFGPSHTVDDNIRGCRKGYQKTSDGCILTTTMPTETPALPTPTGPTKDRDPEGLDPVFIVTGIVVVVIMVIVVLLLLYVIGCFKKVQNTEATSLVDVKSDACSTDNVTGKESRMDKTDVEKNKDSGSNQTGSGMEEDIVQHQTVENHKFKPHSQVQTTEAASLVDVKSDVCSTDNVTVPPPEESTPLILGVERDAPSQSDITDISTSLSRGICTIQKNHDQSIR